MDTVTRFENLNLKPKNEKKTFTFNDNSIGVWQYLPFYQKYDLIMITLQDSKENGYYNALRLEVNFCVNLVLLYTDMYFSDEDKQDKMALYDLLEENGIIDLVISNIPSSEYDFLKALLAEQSKTMMSYENSFAGVANGLINKLPESLAQASQFIEGIDKDKLADVINLTSRVNPATPAE